MILLLVDDNAANRKLLRVTLGAKGHTTLEACDGVDALQVLEREKVDAVISDILMPNMDGFRLCHEIRRSRRLSSLPFIIYTSTYTSVDDVKLAETVGADKYLTKPVPAGVMLAALAEVMEKNRTSLEPSVMSATEMQVLKPYSQVLIRKLEEKNSELKAALESVQRANNQILDLNSGLERRVKERTAELEATNRQLTQALSQVKELNALLPICSYCKKIRDDTDYWQSVEGYISQHTDSKFTHGICPGCYEEHIRPQFIEHGIPDPFDPLSEAA